MHLWTTYCGSLPLTTQQFQILLSLTDGHLHGYAHHPRRRRAHRAAALRLGTGTLYTALARLETLALVEETDPRGRRERRRRTAAAITG